MNVQAKDEEIPKYIQELIVKQEYIGRMNDPDGSAQIKGPCGDEMEFYLLIANERVKEIKFYTTGCFFTYACGTMTSHLSSGKTISEVLEISPGQIIKELRYLPKDHCHCAILSVTTLYRAIVNYWLKG